MINLKFGQITNIDYNGRVRVKIQDMDGFVTDFSPVIKSKSKNDKDGNWLDIDEEVAILYDDETDDCIVLGAINSDSSPLSINDRNKKYFTFSDGTHFEYDKASHKFCGEINGDAEIKCLNLNCEATAINSIGTLNHIGDINVSGTLSATKLLDTSAANGSFQNVIVTSGIVTGGS